MTSFLALKHAWQTKVGYTPLPKNQSKFGLVEFENIQLEPVGIIDCVGDTHQFHFQTRLLGNIVCMEAIELQDGSPSGYRFQLTGDPEEDVFAMLGRLILKIRQALSVRHIVDGKLGPQIVDKTVRGRIEWDEAEEGRVPLTVIDGREFSWAELGEILMRFEGWQFRLEMIDPADQA